MNQSDRRVAIDKGIYLFKYKTRPSWYLEINSQGKQKRISLNTYHKHIITLQIAQEMAYKQRYRHLNVSLPNKLKLCDVVNEYISYCSYYNASITIELKTQILKCFINWLKQKYNVSKILLSQITSQHVMDFLNNRSKIVKPISVNEDRQRLHEFFAYCVKKKYIYGLITLVMSLY
ncbi:MAG: hypothetical protein HY606_12570 [Planctomycetes bacterium]|nr:hypothetical protein [Planctomycetota bacterium]